MPYILSLAPIAIIIFSMLVLRWGAARAGIVGYISAMFIAYLFFGAGFEIFYFSHTKAIFLSIDVIMIVWAAFFLYRIVDEAGAVNIIGQALAHLTSDAGLQAMIIGWIFASFLEGIGGFGVPVAVVAPILLSLGFSPFAAVVIPSVGHGWAVTFGSLGAPFRGLLSSTGYQAELLTIPTAIFLGIAGLLSGFMVIHLASGWDGLKRLIFPVLIFGCFMGFAQYFAAIYGLWNIGAFCGGLVGLIMILPLAHFYQSRENIKRIFEIRSLILALSGYIVMIAIILGVQFIKPLQDVLGTYVFQIYNPLLSTNGGWLSLPPYITPAGLSKKIVILSHTGVLLFYSSLIAYGIYYKANLYIAGSAKKIIYSTFNKVLLPSISILFMVNMAVIMEFSGMTDTLANGLAKGMRDMFPLITPWVGSLGAFMTGSNTNSNVVFGLLQLKTAQLLDFSESIILAGQTTGASLGSVLAPTKIAVGVSTVGMIGKEGDVLYKLFGYIALLIFLISLLTLISVNIHVY